MVLCVGGGEGVCVGGSVGGRGWGAGLYGKVDETSSRTCKKIQAEERLKKENRKKTTKRQSTHEPRIHEL